MGSLGYVWHAQPESYDQLLWILKENHVKKRRLRKTTTKWSLKGAKKYHTGIYSLNRPLLQVDEAINQKVLLDFLLQIGGLLCCWEINFAILLSRSKKLTQMEMWHSHIWLLAESQHTLATSCHWIYKNLEPCGQKEQTQQQSQTKKKPIISTTLLQLFNFFNHIFVPARTDSIWVEVNLQNLHKSKPTKFCLLNCVVVCYIHDQKIFNSWLHCTCLWCQDKDNVYSDKHCVLENRE